MACRGHEESTELCDLLPIAEEAVVSAVFHLYYKLRHQGGPILTQLLADLQNARKGKLLWSLDIVALNQKIADITRQDRLLAQLKQQGVVDPDIFISRADLLAERRRELKRKKERIIQAEEDDTIQRTEQMLDTLESGPDWLETFDEEIFNELIEKIMVLDNETLHFRLLNGLEIPEKIERTRR